LKIQHEHKTRFRWTNGDSWQMCSYIHELLINININRYYFDFQIEETALSPRNFHHYPPQLVQVQLKYTQEKHWCKASKGVQARNAESEDELVDIWWQDYILINFSMVNWFLPEWTDERHCSLWTLIGMLEIRILLVISLYGHFMCYFNTESLRLLLFFLLKL
jgi:hypothetical protein